MRRVHLFTSSWDALRRTVAQLPDDAFEAASGCRGWRTADLVQHLSLQAQELLIALAAPAETPPTADSLSWWTPTTVFPTGDSDEDALLARLADAQGGPVRSREHFEHVAAAAGRAALLAHPDLPVAAAERILTVRDLLGALVLEVTLHHLDLHAHLPDFALSSPMPPPADALAEARDMVERRLRLRLPARWADEHVLRVATGRRAPTAAEHTDFEELGERGQMLPLAFG